MNSPTTFIMYLFDIGMIAACAIATIAVARQWPRLSEMRARTSAILVVSGIWAQTSVYVADLYSMTLLRYLQGQETANQHMMSIHTIYAWYASMVSTILIATSIVMFTQKFILYMRNNEKLSKDVIDQKKRLDQASSLAKLGSCIFNFDSEKIEFCTEAHANNYGLTRAEYMNVADTSNLNLPLVHPDDQERVQQYYSDFHAGEAVELEYRVPSPDGEKIVREIKQPIFDKNGKVIREIMTSLDITQKNVTETELRITRQHLEAAIIAANIGIFDVDIRKGDSIVSSTWKTLMGFEPGEEIDSQSEWLKRVHPEDLIGVKEADAACLSGKTPRSEVEYRIRIADDTWRWMKSVAIPYENSSEKETQRLVGVQLDITKQKETAQIQKEFVSIVSHELRTPLSSIHGALGLLRGKMLNELPSDAGQLLCIAQRNSDRLVRLIDDIIDIEKLSAKNGMQFNYVQSDIVELVELTIDSVRPLYMKLGIEIDLFIIGQSDAVFVDTGRFEQVLVNLMSNAIKFSPMNGKVRVTIESNSDSTKVSVTDQGPGIPPDFSDFVFDRFTQADSSDSRNNQGAGLGLYISKQIVERMGGQIGFQSEANVETTFWVIFPKNGKKALMAA